MAINKNHPFEDLDGIKCAVVESGASEERKDFLKDLLEFNGYTVVVSAEVVKAAAPVAAPESEGTAEAVSAPRPAPLKYKVGVTDVTFNSINAIYGRLLRTKDRRIVTMAYWLQQERVSRDDIPYFDAKH